MEPTPADALLNEISELYSLILLVSSRVHDPDAPLTTTQRLALIELSNAGPLRVRALARRMDTTPATASRAVDALESWGYVQRRPDPFDRRGVLVQVTRRGTRWAERRQSLLRGVFDQLPATAIPLSLLGDLARLNAELRVATGHDEVPRGLLLAQAGNDRVR